MSAVEPAAPPAGPLHAEKMYATPGSARYAVAPRADGLCDDKSESLFKYILSFVLDCPKLSIRFVQRFLSVNIHLLQVVPDVMKNPVLTALFERILREVEAGNVPLDVFIEKQKQLVINELRRLRK